MRFKLILFLVFIGQLAFGQCYPDRHNTSMSGTWVSCERSESINPSRGNSIWISYDLGEVKTVKSFHFWNINHPDYLDMGAKQIAIDYSTDGVNWDFFQMWEVGQGTASGFYEGEPGPDLNDLEARYILLTLIDNYGGNCAGFAEIRIGVESNMSNTVDASDLQSSLKAYPNPATSFTTLIFDSAETGAATLELLDLSGRTIQAQEVSLVKGEMEFRYDVAAVQSGQYIIRMTTPRSEFSTDITVIKTK